MSLDKKQLSINDLIKILPTFISIISFGWVILTKLDKLESKIEEVKIYKTVDDKVVNNRLNRLELLTENHNNRTTEIEKDIIRIFAILPNKPELPKIKENADNN